jgi:hypothetical protein
LLLALASSLSLGSKPAAASPTAADRAMAQSLFEDGRRLMAAGDFASACPKLEESQALDPSGGTLLNLAVCHEKQGRLATAWSDFKEALSVARRDNRADRFEVAEQHLATLEPQVPSLTIRVVRAKPEQQVLLDGAPVRPAAWGTPIAVDPGSHRLEASAAGHAAWAVPLEVAVAEHKVVVIPELALDSGLATTATDTTKTPAHAEVEGGNAVGWVALGTGVVGLGIGSYFGLAALSTQNDVEKECPTPRTCSPKGVELTRDAQSAAWASNIGIGVGIVGVVMGGYLLLTSPASEKRTAARTLPEPVRVNASRHGGELSVQGVW